MDESKLSRAVVVWTGWGRTPWPSRDESDVVREFGSEVAAELMPRIRELEDDFYESDARHVVKDVARMGIVASERFRHRHPEVTEEAVQALAWCYTYDYK